jgi:NADH-quinone oxidoreductase subunit A
MRSLLYFEFCRLGIFFSIGFLLSVLLLLISFAFSEKITSSEKYGSYECGFEPFDDTRNIFDVHFFLVAIIFVIFDLEIIFIFPWLFALPVLGFSAFWAMVFFLVVLTAGFIFEWSYGALVWPLSIN